MRNSKPGRRKGWSLILLLFILASFVATFPLIATFSDNRGKGVTVLERWTQWQKGREGVLQIAAARGGSSSDNFTIIYDPLPGGNTMEVLAQTSFSSGAAPGAETGSIPFAAGSGVIPPNSIVEVISQPSGQKSTFEVLTGGNYVIEAIGGGASPNFRLTLTGHSAANIGKNLPGASIKIFASAAGSGESSYEINTSTTINTTDPAGFSEESWSGKVVGVALDFAGLGTELDPFIIDSAVQLDKVRKHLEPGKYFKIVAPIDLSVSPWVDGAGWVPIGTAANPFRGNITAGVDSVTGQYFPVDRLTIDRSINGAGFQGLFGVISGGKISHLRLTNVNVKGGTDKSDNTGAFAGLIEAGGELENCHVDGSVSGFCYVGGLVGRCSASIINQSMSSASVKGEGRGATVATGDAMYIGGLAGCAEHGSSIVSSSNSGNVAGNSLSYNVYGVGGLTGLASNNVTFSNSFNVAMVTSTAANNVARTGGLVGEATNSISFTSSYNTGQVRASGQSNTSMTGGLAGKATVNVTFTDSYNNAAVISDSTNGTIQTTGGLTGHIANGSFTRCSNAGPVNSSSSSGLILMTGGLAGEASNVAFTDSYNAGAVKAVSPAQSVLYTGGLVGFCKNASLSRCYNQAFIEVKALSSEATGGLLGGYNCSLALVFQENYNEGAVTGLNCTGGLIGQAFNSVDNTAEKSYNTGNIQGNDNCGGLVGWNGYNSNRGQLISQCFSRGIISGQNNVGGLAGQNSLGRIANSYNTGEVLGLHRVGGLAGYNANSDFDRCYSAGKITGKEAGSSFLGGLAGEANLTSALTSYWNTETSGCALSPAGNPRNTLQMLTAGTFAGWNFTDIWKMTEVKSGANITVYPYLKYQSYAGDTASPRIGTLKYVAGGSFQRDATATNVSVVSSFRMSQHEITRSQFLAIMGADPSDNYASGMSGPVQQANWYHAITFCNKLSIAEGLSPAYSVLGVNFSTLIYSAVPTTSVNKWNNATCNFGANGYRLPTEMEWMWAAMGGKKDHQAVLVNGVNTTGRLKNFAGAVKYSNDGWLGGVVGDYVWYSGNASYETKIIGLKKANESGIYDMSGNVWEWCFDFYSVSSSRVMHGGSYYNSAAYGSIAYRLNYSPASQFINVGFRVVRP